VGGFCPIPSSSKQAHDSALRTVVTTTVANRASALSGSKVAPEIEPVRGSDAFAATAVAVLFVVMLVVTWQRWTHPVIDHGREMNVPARIASGERLYTDIYYYYGPFAPYFNALLYRAFGVRLSVLHASGIACAALIIAALYWVARRLLHPYGAAAATGLVLTTCALNLWNYVQPYAYAALYGFGFALAALIGAVRFVETANTRWLVLGGSATGVALLCKPEWGVIALFVLAGAWYLASLNRSQYEMRPLLHAIAAAVTIAVPVYALLVWRVSWQTLIGDTYRMASRPQVIYFSRWTFGTVYWPYTGWAIASATALSLLVCVATALAGLALAPGRESLWHGRARTLWMFAVASILFWSFGPKVPLWVDVNPFRSAPVMLSLAAAWALWRAYRVRVEKMSTRIQIVLVLALFTAGALARVMLNISLTSAYTPFTLPPLILLYVYLLLEVAPELLLRTHDSREYMRRCALTLLGVYVCVFGFVHASFARTHLTSEVSTARGRLLSLRLFGSPMSEAIRFVQRTTVPGEYVLSLPQGTLVNFLADRPNPIREESIVPGLLTADGEATAIHAIEAKQVRLILVENWLTGEYGESAFGVDYNQSLMRWIEEHYHVVRVFSNDGESPQLGEAKFFIRAYERNS
jgi:Dolichyl-phosphate-mannose-protein mannosyltransferase